jgi:hypothetical protein
MRLPALPVSLPTDERHEAASLQARDHHPALLLAHQLQLLCVGWPDRDYQASTLAQLFK